MAERVERSVYNRGENLIGPELTKDSAPSDKEPGPLLSGSF